MGPAARNQKARRRSAPQFTPRPPVLAICPNPFGCGAGADPKGTVFASDIALCNSCNEELVPKKRFEHRLECCPMCKWLFDVQSVSSGGHVASAIELLDIDHFSASASLEIKSCWLCGFVPSSVRDLLVKARDKKTSAPEETKQVEDFFQIIRMALMSEPDQHLENTLTEIIKMCCETPDGRAGSPFSWVFNIIRDTRGSPPPARNDPLTTRLLDILEDACG